MARVPTAQQASSRPKLRARAQTMSHRPEPRARPQVLASRAAGPRPRRREEGGGSARPGPGERQPHLPERKGLRPTQGGLLGRRGRALRWGAEREEGRAEGSGAGRGRRYRGREAQNPLGQGGEGRSLRQWRRPGPEGKRNNRCRCAWPQPWGRAAAGARGGAVRQPRPESGVMTRGAGFHRAAGNRSLVIC